MHACLLASPACCWQHSKGGGGGVNDFWQSKLRRSSLSCFCLFFVFACDKSCMLLLLFTSSFFQHLMTLLIPGVRSCTSSFFCFTFLLFFSVEISVYVCVSPLLNILGRWRRPAVELRDVCLFCSLLLLLPIPKLPAFSFINRL